MRPITSAELLTTWEKCAGRTLPEKALLFLDAACADGDPQDPAILSIGERDAKLLLLREWIFGPHLLNIADCPICKESIEWTNNIVDLIYPSTKKTTQTTFQLKVENYHIQFRLPNSYDLSKAALHDYRVNPEKLLVECIIDVHQNAQSLNANELPAQVLELLEERMATEDPQANVVMNLSCPACSHYWDAHFDIVSYLWTEVDNWAKHMLQDIAELAVTFGWSELQILTLSPQRRQLYLDIIRQ